jgi:transposase
VKPAAARKRAINRGALPLHLPREEIVIDVADKTCACCGVRRQFYDIQAKTPAPIGTADHLRGH